MLMYALHATTFMRTTTGLPMIVVTLDTGCASLEAMPGAQHQLLCEDCLNCEDSFLMLKCTHCLVTATNMLRVNILKSNKHITP